MKLVPYDVRKVKGYKLCRNQQLIQEFLDSGLDCAKIEDFPHKDARSCMAALSISAKRMGIGNVIACTRKGEVFLIRTNK